MGVAGFTSFLTWSNFLPFLHLARSRAFSFRNPIPLISSYTCPLHVFSVVTVFSDLPSWNSVTFLMHHPHLCSKHVSNIAPCLLWPTFPQFLLIPACSSIHQCCCCPSVSRHTSLLPSVALSVRLNWHLILPQTPCLTAVQHSRSHTCPIDPFIFSENFFPCIIPRILWISSIQVLF